MALLDYINKPGDIRRIPEDRLNDLAKEIRRYIIKIISANGGHLASNLGAVELTIALHRYLKLPKDKLIWDVGHQTYAHKLLTGRKEELNTLRQLDGLSGFPKIKESEFDAFGTGHASTSISAALGMVAARDIRGGNEKIVAVIGDGAMTGGMALEALNNADGLNSNLIIILNDNERSISENVGGVARYLGKIRTSRNYQRFKDEVTQVVKGVPGIGGKLFEKLRLSKESVKRLFVPGMFFEDMGITYLGPVDGHNIADLKEALNNAGRVQGAVIIHAITRKGNGYKKAEEHPARFHGVEPFDIKTGEVKSISINSSYTQIFSDTMLKLAEDYKDIVAITAAMPYGTGLYTFKKKYPERFFDVGIAEEHAVTFAAGLASAGMKPVVAIYSTFLQRAYDQILHDVCLQELPVVFAVDRAGLVGSDGDTHQGIFDVGYLSTIPGLTILSPKDGKELREMLVYAVSLNKPVAVRYPKGEAEELDSGEKTEIKQGENEILKKGKNVAVLATGKAVKTALKTAEILTEKGITPTVVSIRFLDKPDVKLLRELRREHSTIALFEENVFTGSYSERLMAVSAAEELNYRFVPFTLPDDYIEHGKVAELEERYGFIPKSAAEKIYDAAMKKLDRELFDTNEVL